MLIGVLASCVFGMAAAQAPADREVAFVANAEDATVTLVDIAARRAFATIDVNPERASVQRTGTPNFAQDTDVSPDGRVLYVSRGYLGDVVAFEVATGRVLWRRPLNTARADHMTLSPDGRSLFVSAMPDNLVYRLAASSGEITGRMSTGVYPHDNKLTKDGRTLVNTSLGPIGGSTLAPTDPAAEKPLHARQITIADAGSLAVRERIEVADAFRPWAFWPDQKGIYGQLSNHHAVVSYDLAQRRIVRRLELPKAAGVTPADFDFEAPHHGLALTEDGRTLCLAGRASDYVALVRAPELELIATIKVADAPGWAEVTEDGETCLVPTTRSNELSIISIPRRAEVARLSMGKGPKHVTVARMSPTAIAAATR
jgi:DNA-binding beta-propeller fold protein YncE